MIITIVGVILIIVIVAIVSSPFFPLRKRLKSYYYISDDINELLAKRDRLYEEMRILQLDYELGNLNYEDYTSQIDSHRIEAATLIQKQTKLQSKDLDQALENEIKAFKESSTFNTDTDPFKDKI